jgi:uncharacterized protein YbjT (DUF2867 family)
MSTIAIIGGHGKVGLLTSRELSSSGHSVRSVIRNPGHAADVEAAGATPVVLDIETATPSELAASIGPVDAIIFTAGAGGGSGPERKETVDHQGARKSIGAASELGVQRFVLVSYLGADDPSSSGGDPSMAAYQRAKHAADEAVRASSLDWTIVRPGTLNDDAATRRVTIGDAITEGTTSRGNVAALLALLVTDGPAPRRVLNVIDGDTELPSAIAGDHSGSGG